MSEEIRPFKPDIPQSEVDRLWRKLKDTRLPEKPIVPNAGDEYGPPLEWVHKLYNLWVNDFKWAPVWDEITALSHYKTHLEGMDIHFVHKKAAAGGSKKPIPLLLVHGWPGTWFEFNRTIEPLTNPKGDEQPFDVVVPSLPGFTWSDGPPKGWTLQDSARIFVELMRRLGYPKFVAQGGDWGHWVMRELGARFSDSCVALHTNMCPSEPPPGSELTEREIWCDKQLKWWLGEPKAESHMAYAIEMRTRPQSIGIITSDNPVGIMIWIGEKYHELVDPYYHDLNDANFVRDLLTTLCLYYFTSPSIMTSTLCYYNNVRHEDYVWFNTRDENLIKAPFAFSSFPYDISPQTERAVATTGNLQWYKMRDFGGHFAALEAPEAMVADMRDFYPKFWKQ